MFISTAFFFPIKKNLTFNFRGSITGIHSVTSLNDLTIINKDIPRTQRYNLYIHLKNFIQMYFKLFSILHCPFSNACIHLYLLILLLLSWTVCKPLLLFTFIIGLFCPGFYVHVFFYHYIKLKLQWLQL